MTIEQIQMNALVRDSWYNDLGIGVITKIFKKTIHVSFDGEKHIYDYPNAIEFLKLEK